VDLLSLKTVIRCADFDCARDFYTRVLGLPVAEEWSETEGRGAVFPIGGGYLEIYAMTTADPRYRPAFREAVPSDKIDVQLRTTSLDEWVERLRGLWPFDGPAALPWGQRWIRLRDPDGLLIALYEEAASPATAPESPPASGRQREQPRPAPRR
jgi:catechol 2,3-dioxygenase-like lactoylglutathione lyase family enzyme